MPIGIEQYVPRYKAQAIAVFFLAAGITVALSCFRTRHTPEEWKAIQAAEAASKRAGWWADGYEARSVGKNKLGWFVGIDHPGHYSGGHHGVLLDPNYRLIRLIGGK